MRVTVLSTFFDPDIGYEEFYTTKYMASRGWDVTMLTTDVSNDGKTVYSCGEEETPYGFRIVRLPCLFRYGSDFVFMRRFTRAFESSEPDLVFMHGSRLPQYLKAARRCSKNKRVLFVDHHDFFYPGHAMRPLVRSFRSLLARLEYHRVRRPLSKAILKRADRIIPVTRICAEHLTGYLDVPKEKLIEPEFAVDREIFHFDSERRKALRSEWRLGKTDFLLNFTGVITRRKAFEKLVDLALALKEERSLRFLVAGYFREGSYEREMAALIRERGLADSFIFTGRISKDEVRDYYSASDGALWIQNNSVSILEAMACGCIVFVPRMHLAHLVDGNGRVFEPGDVSELRNAVREVLHMSGQARQKMRDRSIRLVLERHDYGKYIDLIQKEYTACRRLLQ